MDPLEEPAKEITLNSAWVSATANFRYQEATISSFRFWNKANWVCLWVYLIWSNLK